MSASLEDHPLRSLVKETFQVGTPPYALTAPLVMESANHTVNPTSRQETLSCTFTGPAEPFVAQGMYFFLHEKLDPQLYFVVPTGQTADGYQYEVTFTRIQSETSEAHKESNNG